MSAVADYRHVSFAMGKARVAPMKHHTIPELELMAAVTATRLKQMLLKEHECNFSGIFMWTDSTTVLQWIRNNDKKQPVFVANRVAEILDSTTVDQWNHIDGVKNPADLGTRGIGYPELMESDWLQGAHWLKQEDWISFIGQGLIDEQQQVDDHFEDGTASEEQMFVGLLTLKVIDWKRFSQFNRLRFTIMRILKLLPKYRGYSLVDLLKSAEFKNWSLVQQESFGNEIISFKKTMSVHSKSKLIGLLPFLDSNGIMRAKGRLRKADVGYQTKHPVILPSQHWAVRLFLENMHKRWHHEGVEYVRSIVQRKFWILGLRNALRSVKQDCVQCKKMTKTMKPQMSDLPASRVEGMVYSFSNCGVDYLGPFQVKHFRKVVKKRICLFTCFSTRAVHLEIVSTLDTQSCLDAIHPFVARRGYPKTIQSDIGTNFVGAAREFRELFAAFKGTQLEEDAAKLGIKWTFNPPGAPHFGGVWERLVRSCKRAMWNILGSQSLKEEQLTTVVCTVEQLLNNRPMAAAGSDVEDLEALTPNHLLLGRSTIDYPNVVFNGGLATIKKAFWRHSTLMKKIWDRWMKENLPQLSTRKKWANEEQRVMAAGDLVWICDKQCQPLKYPLGRVLELHTGDDSISRSDTVKTHRGVLKRPLVSLVPLEIDRQDVFGDQKQGRRCCGQT